MAQFNFNARSVQPDTGVMDPIPAGWYNVMCDQTELKPTNDGQGAYLEARFNVLDGQHKDRKLFSRFNVRNNSAQAQEIAYKQLSALCHAIGVFDVQDTNQLCNVPLKVKVSVRGARPKDPQNPTGEQYEASNEVKAYRNINEPVDMAAATAPAGYAQTQGAPQGFAVPNQPQPMQHPMQQPQQPQPWQAPQQPQPWQGAGGMGAPNVPPAQPQQPFQQPQQGTGWVPQQQPQPTQQQQPQQPQQPIPGTASQPWAQAGQPGGMQPQQPQQPQPWQGQQPQNAVPPWQR